MGFFEDMALRAKQRKIKKLRAARTRFNKADAALKDAERKKWSALDSLWKAEDELRAIGVNPEGL